MDHPVAVAQAARQLLLLQVHHPHDAGQFGIGVAVVKQAVLRWHPHLREHDPAHPVQLRQTDGAAHAKREHAPQAALQVFGLHGLRHFVLADDAVGLYGVLQLSGFKLLAGDKGEHHAVAPGESQLACVRAIGLPTHNIGGAVAATLPASHYNDDQMDRTEPLNRPPTRRRAAPWADKAFSSIPIIGDIALMVMLAMAVFAVLFGTRQTDATEHQHGLMLAVATESIVKLVAFLTAGAFVTFWMFSPVELVERADLSEDQATPISGQGLKAGGDDHHAADDIGMAAEIFRCRMHGHIDA